MTGDEAIHDDGYRLAGGPAGEALAIPSADPRNSHQAVSGTAAMPRRDLRAKLFMPEGNIDLHAAVTRRRRG